MYIKIPVITQKLKLMNTNNAIAFPAPPRLRPGFRETIGLRLTSILSRRPNATLLEQLTTNHNIPLLPEARVLSLIYNITIEVSMVLNMEDNLRPHLYLPFPNQPEENTPERIDEHNQVLLGLVRRFVQTVQDKVMDDFYILDRTPPLEEFSIELLTTLINEMVEIYRISLEEMDQAIYQHYNARPCSIRNYIYNIGENIKDTIEAHMHQYME